MTPASSAAPSHPVSFSSAARRPDSNAAMSWPRTAAAPLIPRPASLIGLPAAFRSRDNAIRVRWVQAAGALVAMSSSYCATAHGRGVEGALLVPPVADPASAVGLGGFQDLDPGAGPRGCQPSQGPAPALDAAGLVARGQEHVG